MLPPFRYLVPTTLSQASELLSAHGPRACALAGGTALLVALERAQQSADAVVNLKGIPGLDNISFDATTGLHIGALTTLAQVARSPLVRSHYPVLVETIEVMATPQVRNLATIGGNLCTGNPSADLAVTFLALDAVVTVYRADGERAVALDSFFPTWGGAALAPGEILTGVQIPISRGTARYCRFMLRQAADVPLANVAIALERLGDSVSHARIVLGGNGARPTRMLRAEHVLRHEPFGAEAIAHATELVVVDAYPPDDARASRAYRRHVLGVITRRALAKDVSNDFFSQ